MSLADAEVSEGRRRLLDAANELFSRGSYLEVTVAQILEAGGVRAPSLYYHFRDKEDLYVAWAEDAMDRLGERLSREQAEWLSVHEGLTRFVSALSDDAAPNWMGMLQDARRLERPESGERIASAFYGKLFEPLCGTLLRAMERGELRSESVSRLAALFLAGVLGLGPTSVIPGSPGLGDPTWWPKRFADAFKPQP